VFDIRQHDMGKIVAVCVSTKKGEKKTPVDEGLLKEECGILGDAHADSNSHRQVSLLAMESIEKMKGLGLELSPGDFAENLTTEGIDLLTLPIGTTICVGNDVVLEVSQIGKECHSGCAILKQTGKCIMPKEGIFTRVVCGGTVKAGDPIRQS